MCISGRFTTVRNIRRSRAIIAYRNWSYRDDMLKPAHYRAWPEAKTWLTKLAKSNRIPPKACHSDIGLHALQDPHRDNDVSGTVRLWGRVIVHRETARGKPIGYRAQHAEIVSLRLHSNSGNLTLETIRDVAKRYGVRVTGAAMP